MIETAAQTKISNGDVTVSRYSLHVTWVRTVVLVMATHVETPAVFRSLGTKTNAVVADYRRCYATVSSWGAVWV